MFTFQTPGYLFLLLLIPVGVFLRHIYRRRGGLVEFAFAMWKGPPFAPPQRFAQFVLFLVSFVFWVGVALLILSLAGPARVRRERIHLSRGMDIMIVLDESPSMSAQDFQPVNRFETAKDVIRNFADGRENDAIGLVSFSREAALRVPPTLDRAVLFDRLASLRIMSLGDGTAIGMGLSIAALHLERSMGSEKIILLLTDGENNAGEIPPESAADIASKLGIRIYAIGIGTQGEVPIEFTDPETGIIKKGLLDSRFNEDLLKRVAATARGRYFSAKSPGALNAVFRTIDTLETTEKRVKIRINSEPLHRIFIAVALCCILFDFFVRKLLLKEVMV